MRCGSPIPARDASSNPDILRLLLSRKGAAPTAKARYALGPEGVRKCNTSSHSITRRLRSFRFVLKGNLASHWKANPMRSRAWRASVPRSPMRRNFPRCNGNGTICPEGREPDPFFHPIMIAAAVGQASANEAPVVLAWQAERLVGVWPFISGHSRSGAPVRVLKTPVHPTMADGTPVIDSAVAEPALSAMLDAIKSSAALPKILSVSSCNEDGPVMAALHRACLSRGRGPAILRRATRPYLACQQDPDAYFAQALSSSRRRKLGQLRRRLATRGHIELKVHRDYATVSESLERFMQLEAKGWKAVSGNPLLGTGGAAFARADHASTGAPGACRNLGVVTDRSGREHGDRAAPGRNRVRLENHL